jgi:TP901 family phage tail tape measure protein
LNGIKTLLVGALIFVKERVSTLAQTPEAKVKISVFNKEFNDGMKEMGREAGRLRQEFQLQEEQMKHSASETDKLRARMQYLTQQQELAARRVQETQRQYAAVAAQYGENSQAAQEMNRRLISARTEEQRLANQIHETNQSLSEQETAFDRAQQSIGEFGDKMSTAGEGLSKAVTLPILGVGAAALKTASDVDSAAGKIQASLGVTGESAEELGGIAKNLWRNAFGEDMNAAGEAVSTVFKNMRQVSIEELEKVTEYAFIVADTFGADIVDSTKTANQLMTTFGLTAQESFDLITTGFQEGLDFSGEFLDTLTEYSPQFYALGYSAQEMYATLAAGAESGAFNLDKVGDAMKEFNIRIKDGSKSTSEGMAELSKGTQKVWKDFLAGKESGKAVFEAVIQELSKMEDGIKEGQIATSLFGTQWEDLEAEVVRAMDTSTYHIEGFEGATQKAGDALYDNFGSRLTSTLRGVQEALLPIGETILGIVESALPAIEKMSAAFTNLSPAVQKIIMIVGAVAAALGPLLMVIGMVANGIQVVIGWLAPLIAAITEAGGLIAFLSTKFTALFAAITGPIGIVIASVVALIAIFVALYKNNEEFRNKVNEIWASIKASFQTALTFIKGIVNTVMREVTAFFSAQLAVIRQFWDQNGKQIMSLVKTYFSLISSYIQMVMGVIKGIFQAVWPVITNVVRIAWSAIQTVIKNAMALVMGVIKTALQLIQGDWSGAWNTIKSTASTIMNNILSFFKGINLYQVGKDIINGLVNGIGSMAGAVKKMVSKLASNIPEWAKDILGIRSPSRVMIEVGEDTGEGAVVGLENKLAKVKRVASEFAQTFIPDMSPNPAIAAAGGVTARAQAETLQLAFQKQAMPSHITVISKLDGYEVARNQYPFIDGMLEMDYGKSRRSMGEK